tara:strand:- start:7657 stop:11886 length:4230 start_codon:yes stop_codon:yes gene_type:complete
MAEIKNSFLKSKMNKDLDDRLVPNGEYRDAQNISVGKSEDDDIGALETVLGNVSVASLGSLAANENLEAIGVVADEARKQFYIFYTDYRGADTYAPSSAFHYIYLFNPDKNIFHKLVEGDFLNFSTQYPVQATLVEELLFFTDNRNQPRKINITRSLGYYTLENQISVAKYNPYEPISLLKKSSGTINARIDNTSFTINILSFSTTNVAVANVSTITVTGSIYSIKPGMIIGFAGMAVNTFVSVLSVSTGSSGGIATIVLSENVTLANGVTINFYPNFQKYSKFVSTSMVATRYYYVNGWAGATSLISVASTGPAGFLPTLTSGEDISFFDTTMTNESLNPTWPGDPDLLKDKFVRFSYRFQFDDGEFSIIAPFTQIAFIPKQQGYFIDGNEAAAFRSTVLDWMENNVQNVELIVPLPDLASSLGTENSSKYKITAIELIYKESDSLATKVLEKVPISDINCTDCSETKELNYYIYNYQSRKPYKTLPTIQTTRVFDKVPTKALAQETAGNRIMYGNFWNQHTPPNTLNYRLGVSEKKHGVLNENFMEYPTHSLKQNRTYQAGVILSDKWGRQSSVILSSVENKETVDIAFPFTKYGGSTVYNGYKKGIVSTRNNATSNSTIVLTYPQLKIEKGMVISGGGINPNEKITVATVTQGTTTTTITTTVAKTIAQNATLYFNDVTPSYFFGDALQLSFDQPISSGRILNSTPNYPFEATGEPGLYAVSLGDGLGFNIANNIVGSATVKYQYTVKVTNVTPVANRPSIGKFFRGKDTDYVKITQVSSSVVGSYTQFILIFDGNIADSYFTYINSTTPHFAYDINETGWYSYKIVVKQQEQDYYNVYTPGILAGYPGQVPEITSSVTNPGITNSIKWVITDANDLIQIGMSATGDGSGGTIPDDVPAPFILTKSDDAKNFTLSSPQTIGIDEDIAYTFNGELEAFPINEIGVTGHTVLINDNINKIPRDLTEVGPEQKQFRSSVQLFPRVSNSSYNDNVPFYPGTNTDTAITIATASDLNFKQSNLLDQNYINFYQFDTNPLICRIETGIEQQTTANVNPASAGASINITLTSAPVVPIIPGMIITNTTTGEVYGSITTVTSSTTATCRLAAAIIAPGSTAPCTFTSTLGAPSGKSKIADFSLMEPTLAIYETEPVESLLDLYWESSTSGLISDINEEVILNFDDTVPDRFSSFTFTLTEGLAVGTDVTSSFTPQNKNGDFTDTFINMKVLNGNGVNVTGKFELISTTASNITTYKIKTAAEFEYTHDSSTVDVYNFYMLVRSPFNRNGSNPTNGSNLIVFEGSLSNIAPANQGAAGSVTKSSSFIGEMVSLYGFSNGSTSSSKDGLKFTTTSYSNSGANYFNLNEFTGSLTKTVEAPAGTYNLFYKVSDAWNGSTLGVGTQDNVPSAFTIVIT